MSLQRPASIKGDWITACCIHPGWVCSCSWLLPSLSASWLPSGKQLSFATFFHLDDSALKKADRRLKPWAKRTLSSFKLQVSGILSGQKATKTWTKRIQRWRRRWLHVSKIGCGPARPPRNIRKPYRGSGGKYSVAKGDKKRNFEQVLFSVMQTVVVQWYLNSP